MPDFTILYDEPQEANWFRALHPDLRLAKEEAITAVQNLPHVRDVLAYDRPDIILLDGSNPVLVVEETVEVPSGHNVGQRFARLAAAAESGVPCLYFAPYVAKKHGGETSGPRYMNARLFHALDAMVRVTKTAITTINWPVDENYEVRRDQSKDDDIKEYLATFLVAYGSGSLGETNERLLNSDIHLRMVAERDTFVATSIRNPEQYDGPPPSVDFVGVLDFHPSDQPISGKLPASCSEIVLYRIGMTNIRSDPYTGMAMLYKYLYIAEYPWRSLILHFPEIPVARWQAAAVSGNRKDIRLFRVVADAIWFTDSFLPRADL